MVANSKVVVQLTHYVEKIESETAKYFSEHYEHLNPPKIEVQEGSKYYRIVKNDLSSKSVHSFVDKQTGDIYKAASWKIPAKHIRGNIFDDNCGWGTSVNVFGANYLR